MKNGDPIGEALSIGERVGREEDRLASRTGLGEEFAHQATAERVESRHRLIEEEKGRLVEDRLGQGHPLAHPLREAAHALTGNGRQFEARQNLCGVAPCLSRVKTTQLCPVHQPLLGSQTGIDDGLLRQVSQRTLPVDLVGSVSIETNLHRSSSGAQQAGEDPEEGTLPCPVGPEQREDLSRLDRQRQLVERASRSKRTPAYRVVVCQGLDLNQCHGGLLSRGREQRSQPRGEGRAGTDRLPGRSDPGMPRRIARGAAGQYRDLPHGPT